MVPRDFVWKDPFALDGKVMNFFQRFVKLSTHIILHKNCTHFAMQYYCNAQSIPNNFYGPMWCRVHFINPFLLMRWIPIMLSELTN